MKILLKRFLAGICDLMFINITLSIIAHFSDFKTTNALIMVYAVLLQEFKTTPGGILLNLKVSSMGRKELGLFRAFFRMTLFYMAVICHAMITLDASPSIFGSIIVGIMIFFIGALPAFFTQRRLMIHDIISRSFVEIDDRNKFSKKNKMLLWLTLAALVLTRLTLFYIDSNKTTNCQNLYQQNQYQRVIDECAKFAEKDMNANLHLLVGFSYRTLQNHDAAIDHFISANVLGDKSASYIIAASYIEKQNFTKALMWSEHKMDDPLMLFFTSSAYFMKFGESKNNEDLIKAATCLKLMSLTLLEKKQKSDPIRDNMLSTLSSSGTISEYEKRLTLLSEELLTEKQIEKINATTLPKP